jgi:hypothetical protein
MHTLKPEDLGQFNGSENLYRHALTGFLYTDGVRHVAEAGGAYWLIDAILITARHKRRLRGEAFQLWELKVREGVGMLTCRADSGEPALYRQRIPYTDFPLPYLMLYLENQTLCLPSER